MVMFPVRRSWYAATTYLVPVSDVSDAAIVGHKVEVVYQRIRSDGKQKCQLREAAFP